jgi:hypothetical protein
MNIKLLLTVFIILATVFVVNAQNKTSDPVKEIGKQTTVFVDKNNNGVCDNYENGNRNGQGFGKGNCKGQGKQARLRNGQCGASQKSKSQGKHAGQGPNFVDTNKNGVCDIYENSNK